MARRFEFLAWDTAHFGVRIGRLHTRRYDARTASAVGDWMRNERVRCVYWLADLGDAGSLRRAQESGFRLVDFRVTLVADGPPSDAAPCGEQVRRFVAEDAAPLAAMARTAFRGARFHRDGGFPKGRCDRLYEVWMRNDIAASDGAVLVCGAPGRPGGFVSIRAGGEGTAQIGLIAVAEAQRGHGAGLALVQSAVAWARARGASAVSVVTQGANVPAIRTYERAGFRVRRTEAWLHLWTGIRRGGSRGTTLRT